MRLEISAAAKGGRAASDSYPGNGDGKNVRTHGISTWHLVQHLRGRHGRESKVGLVASAKRSIPAVNPRSDLYALASHFAEKFRERRDSRHRLVVSTSRSLGRKISLLV